MAGYPGQYGNVLVRKETLDKSLNTIIGAPVIINHTNVTADNADDLRVGVISNAYYNDKDGWYWCEGVIWDETAQNLITDKKWSVSCSYDFLEQDDEGGTENNIPYDREFTKLNFVHLALVDNPRYERANIVFNSKTVENSFPGHDGRPGVVGGSLPRNNSMPTVDDYKNPQKDYELPQIPNNILKKLGKEQKPLVLKKNIIEKNKQHHPEINIEEYNSILDSGIYKADVIFKTKNNDDYYNFAHYDTAGNPQILIELSDKKDNYEIVNFYKLNDKNLQRKLKQAIKRVDNEGGQFLIDIEDKTSKVGVLSNLEIDSIYSITDIQEDFNPNMKNNVQNNKEQDMALLEELKKLISTVENSKGEEKMDDKDKEVDNEKVDKRKLIDEVGGILKGKVDEEVWRTVIGKLEKLSYNKSEAGTADNGNDDKEDEKADNKKVKNNETKEDEKKDEELKKNVKEDVENKCKNSVDNSKGGFFDKINEIYNSAMKPKEENIYVSRADKLKAAEEYFS